MKINEYVKILAIILLASCQPVEFQSSSSTLGDSSKETLLNFEKVHIGDEQSLEFVVLNAARFPVTPADIEFRGGGGGGTSFFREQPPSSQ